MNVPIEVRRWTVVAFTLMSAVALIAGSAPAHATQPGVPVPAQTTAAPQQSDVLGDDPSVMHDFTVFAPGRRAYASVINGHRTLYVCRTQTSTTRAWADVWWDQPPAGTYYAPGGVSCLIYQISSDWVQLRMCDGGTHNCSAWVRR